MDGRGGEEEWGQPRDKEKGVGEHGTGDRGGNKERARH
jgi:hypothetical protein